FFQAEDGIRDFHVTGVQTCALPISKYSFDENPVSDLMAKKQKYDLESFTKIDNTWYVFGSGSTENRNTGFMFNKFSKYSTKIDLTDLYSEMKSFSDLQDDDFNIEAV